MWKAASWQWRPRQARAHQRGTQKRCTLNSFFFIFVFISFIGSFLPLLSFNWSILFKCTQFFSWWAVWCSAVLCHLLLVRQLTFSICPAFYLEAIVCAKVRNLFEFMLFAYGWFLLFTNNHFLRFLKIKFFKYLKLVKKTKLKSDFLPMALGN